MSGEGTVNPQRARRLHDADVVYLYDGSFEGFLCCVFESFAQHEIPFAVWTPQRETTTLYPVKDIPTDHVRAQRVFASFGRKLGAETEYLVSRDFLSGRERITQALIDPNVFGGNCEQLSLFTPPAVDDLITQGVAPRAALRMVREEAVQCLAKAL